MAREDLTTRKQKNWIIDKRLAEFVEECSKETNIPQGRIIDEAIKLYKEKVEQD